MRPGDPRAPRDRPHDARSLILFVVAVALLTAGSTGCAATHIVPATPPAKTAASPADCAPGTGLPGELAKPGNIIVFGELHGVKEQPWFFGEAVCSTAQPGLPVAVGLELPVSEQAGVDSFLGSSGQAGDVEALLKGTFWSGKDQDGRASRARVDLLDRLRRLRSAGLRVRVFMFDVTSADNLTHRDQSMAGTIAEQTRSHADEVTMVLVGDAHARKTKGLPWDKDFVPMGWYLEASGLPVYSIGPAAPEGTAWTCHGVPIVCGPSRALIRDVLPSGRDSGIELLATPSPKGYDGLFAVTSLTASPPAAHPDQPPSDTLK